MNAENIETQEVNKLNQNTALTCQKQQENVINYLKETQLPDQV